MYTPYYRRPRHRQALAAQLDNESPRARPRAIPTDHDRPRAQSQRDRSWKRKRDRQWKHHPIADAVRELSETIHRHRQALAQLQREELEALAQL